MRYFGIAIRRSREIGTEMKREFVYILTPTNVRLHTSPSICVLVLMISISNLLQVDLSVIDLDLDPQ